MRELGEALYRDEARIHKGLITVILVGTLILMTAVIGFTTHSLNNKKHVTTNRVSESREGIEKESEAKTPEISERVFEPESEKACERIMESGVKYLLPIEYGKIAGTEDSTARFHEGERIVIEPETRDHYIFTDWTVRDDNVIRQRDGERLIFAMLAEDLTVTAEYKEATYALTVENGTGAGDYHTGDIVFISADEIEGHGNIYIG